MMGQLASMTKNVVPKCKEWGSLARPVFPQCGTRLCMDSEHQTSNKDDHLPEFWEVQPPSPRKSTSLNRILCRFIAQLYGFRFLDLPSKGKSTAVGRSDLAHLPSF